MATGSPPFSEKNVHFLIARHLMDVPSSPRERNPLVSTALEKVILRCLEKNKEQRYRSMEELAVALTSACGIFVDPRNTTDIYLSQSQATFSAPFNTTSQQNNLANSFANASGVFSNVSAEKTPQAGTSDVFAASETMSLPEDYTKRNGIIIAALFFLSGVLIVVFWQFSQAPSATLASSIPLISDEANSLPSSITTLSQPPSSATVEPASAPMETVDVSSQNAVPTPSVPTKSLTRKISRAKTPKKSVQEKVPSQKSTNNTFSVDTETSTSKKKNKTFSLDKTNSSKKKNQKTFSADGL